MQVYSHLSPSLFDCDSFEINYSLIYRGDKVVGPEVTRVNLRCRYSTGHHPFLLLQPVKVEQVSLEPLILVYHEVISDEEINTIKKLARPKVI